MSSRFKPCKAMSRLRGALSCLPINLTPDPAAAANLKMVEDKLREEKRRAAAANGFAAYAVQALEASPFWAADVRSTLP